MSEQKLPMLNIESDEQQLQTEIDVLQMQLSEIEQKVFVFESTLRSELANELVEVQELTVLYKNQKLAKKEKRLAQKQRGKNYTPPTSLKPLPKAVKVHISEVDEKERKRLYREAMLYVHPDKFNMDEEQADLSTEVTTKLIEIYQSGDLKTLQDYHAHIFSGNTLVNIAEHKGVKVEQRSKSEFLKNEKERLEKLIEQVKNKYTYKVLTEYPEPMIFLEELKLYYNDRISKLRRRTRVG
ncbi:hypothetical protein [Roseivirga sp.]|uniref:hypothetical protein n=1 Tax=Roseivirga sp. TaxID=1964215 RepID=UPI002B26DB95|nr:hypothetical protein [Roseivirga sp.]